MEPTDQDFKETGSDSEKNLSVEREPAVLDVAELVADTDFEITFPEGGLAAWSVVLGSFLAFFCCFGIANSFVSPSQSLVGR